MAPLSSNPDLTDSQTHPPITSRATEGRHRPCGAELRPVWFSFLTPTFLCSNSTLAKQPSSSFPGSWWQRGRSRGGNVWPGISLTFDLKIKTLTLTHKRVFFFFFFFAFCFLYPSSLIALRARGKFSSWCQRAGTQMLAAVTIARTRHTAHCPLAWSVFLPHPSRSVSGSTKFFWQGPN